ncbi:MAG: hypothetical protein PF444_02800, partial [Bacteroidales bacterium]|jgi:uncharacterized surface protein with fasciclin (FAS1) repeats|nr:hypothetical protein [Bacteroidales bacterium]
MAEYIDKQSSFSIFSKLLERFCAPYYNMLLTESYMSTHPEFTDSIFVKSYFSDNGGRTSYPETYESINPDLYLNYDPGWNSYALEGSGMQYDMGAMFVPNNEAMLSYLETGSGKVLKERYGDWDGVPNDIAVLFLRRHMRESLILSVPSKFSKMTDTENSKLPVQSDDIISSFVGVNGVVYGTDNVYPPDAYVSVYAPVLYGENSKVFKWAVTAEDFTLYLNSLESNYVFFVPSDDYFDTYIEPVAYAKDVNGVLKFYYDDDAQSVFATVYSYDATTNEIGDSINVIKDADFVANRLLDLLDSHIVVGDINKDGFYFTKGGNVIKVAGSGEQMVIQGGGDIELGDQANVLEVYDQTNLGNGFTYFIDKPLQTPLKSVYHVLKNTPEFSAFFELATGFPSTYANQVFVKKNNYYGIDFNVKFFNTFNYTVYVPTNAAIEQAIADSVIHSWEQINDTLLSPALQEEYMVDLERFIRYHFQDHSVYVGMDIEENYQTAILKEDDDVSLLYTYQNKYYKLGVDASAAGISLSMDKPRYDENGAEIAYNDDDITATVSSDPTLYNIMARDYVFTAAPSSFEEIDGSAGGTNFENSEITTSSTAVIHQIDKILTIE